ncbi:MAG: quinone-dependent dihydroorotate dehydrogenase [Minisyncoccia bacterium]
MAKSAKFKNDVIGFCYKKILRPIFFRMDPERVHDQMVAFGVFLGKYPFTRKLTSGFFGYSDPTLKQNILGINFENPVGLAAGFDKNGVLSDILPSVGFGFTEIGSITGEKCDGNSKPRLWRLQKSRGLLVNYGLKNDGCETLSKRLEDKIFKIPVGVSIAKTNSSETVEIKNGIADYVKAYREMSGIGSFHVINISCPNAFGGEPFTEPARLKMLLAELEKVRVAAPVLLKLSPDLDHQQIDAILEIAVHGGINGIICSNLTKTQNNHKIIDPSIPDRGGFSGKIVEEKSNEQIKYVYKKTAGQMLIIGCGGIFSAEDAYKKIRLGASLVQLITGMIYEGPQLIGEINFGLSRLLKRDGFSNIAEAVGIDNRM